MSGTKDSEKERSTLPDTGVAATGYVCQNFPEHPGEEVDMVSAGPGEGGVVCPECGRMAAGPDDEIPYGDPPDYATDGGTEVSGRYQVNGHDFEVVLEFEGSVNVQCRECLLREHIAAERDDPEDYLGLMTPECQIEWLRRPEDGFHGVALRSASGFSGRELIGVSEGGDTGNGEVANTVRIYDDDRHQLASLLDMREWNRRHQHTGSYNEGGQS